MERFFKQAVMNGALVGLGGAFIIVAGFISNFAESRVLGISEDVSDSVLGYAEKGGDYIIQAGQAVYRFPLNFTYIPMDCFSLVCLGIVLVVFVCALIVKFAKPAADDSISSGEKRKYFCFMSGKQGCYNLFSAMLLIAAFALSINIFSGILTIQSVILPASVSGPEAGALALWEKGAKKAPYVYVLRKFARCETNDKPVSCLFDWRNDRNGVNERKETFITIIQMALILVVVATISRRLCQHKLISSGFIVFLMLQGFFSAYTHGAISSSYSYPIISIFERSNLRDKPAISGVFLISRQDKSLLLLDRRKGLHYLYYDLNGKSTIQVHAYASPFENCSLKETGFELCEESFWR